MIKETTLFLLFGFFGYRSYVDVTYKTCRAPLGIYFGYMLWVQGFAILSAGFMLRNIFTIFWTSVFIIFLVLFVILVLAGLPLMIWNTVTTPACTPNNYTITNWVLVIAFNIILFHLVFTLIKALIDKRKKLRNAEKLKKEIDNIYKKILRSDFDVEKFIKEHGEEVINLFELTEEELNIINDKFSAIVTQD